MSITSTCRRFRGLRLRSPSRPSAEMARAASTGSDGVPLTRAMCRLTMVPELHDITPANSTHGEKRDRSRNDRRILGYGPPVGKWQNAAADVGFAMLVPVIRPDGPPSPACLLADGVCSRPSCVPGKITRNFPPVFQMPGLVRSARWHTNLSKLRWWMACWS